MKRYTLEVVIEEGYDEFWESLKGTGCDEVLVFITSVLDSYGFRDEECKVTLKKFEEI